MNSAIDCKYCGRGRALGMITPAEAAADMSAPSIGRWVRLADLMEWPLALLALLVVPALILEDRTLNPYVLAGAVALNWIVWLAFCTEFVVRWAADRRVGYLRRAWFDLLLIVVSPPFFVPQVLQGARSVRVVRVLRLLRLVRAGAVAGIGLRLSQHLFGRRKFHYTLLVAVAIVVVGALGVFAVENGQNHGITTFGDALWWSVVTATTVGYGDLSPVTTEGRLIAVVLMITGIGVIGVFTATVASLFFNHDQADTHGELQVRLSSVERKLDLVLERLESHSNL
jgi:voltage-gated potassium channel